MMNEQKSIIINQTSVFIYFFLIFGLGILYGGVYLQQKNYPDPEMLKEWKSGLSQPELQWVVISLGLVLISLFIYFFYTRRYQKLIINQSKPFLIIQEKVRGQLLYHEIDWEDFTYFEVLMTQKIPKGNHNKSSKSEYLSATLYRKNGTSIMLFNRVKLSGARLAKLKQWMEFLPLRSQVICEIPEKDKIYLEVFKGLANVQLLTHKYSDDYPISLELAERARFQLPKQTTFKKTERYIPEHERIITIVHWSKTKDIPSNLFGLLFFSLLSFFLVKVLLYEFSLVVFLILILFISLGLYAAYYIYQIYSTYDRTVFGINGIAYSTVWSKESPSTDFTMIPYQQIYSFWGQINGNGFFYINNQTGHQELTKQADLDGLMKLDVNRILINVGLLKRRSGDKIRDRVTDFSEQLVHVEEKYLMLDTKHFSIGERLFFEDLILKNVEKQSS